jgi:4-amino-4-deoxy-L-arabinose transferase-like glycosyltransferase
LPLKGFAGSGGTAILCGLLCAVAAVPRLAGLSTKPLWTDERFSLSETQSVGRQLLPVSQEFESSALVRPTGLLNTIRTSARLDQPAYIAVLTPWTRMFGVSEAALRFPSVIAGVLTVPLLFLAGRRLVGPSAALVAALVVAVSPLHVDLSREARTYAVTLALLVASLLAMVVAEASDRWGRAFLSGILAGAVGVFHLLAAAMLLPRALWWAANGTARRHTPAVLAGVALAWLAATPIGIWQSVLTAHRETGIALQQPPPEERDWARPATAFNIAAGVSHGATRLVGLEPARFGLRTRHVGFAAFLLLAVAGLGARGLDPARRALPWAGPLPPVLDERGPRPLVRPRPFLSSPVTSCGLSPGLALLLARGALGLGPRLGGVVVALALAFPAISLLRPPEAVPDPVQLRHAMVATVMHCYRDGDLVIVSSAEEARTFVGFGGHPTRLSIGSPGPTPSRRWVVSGAELCATGIDEAGGRCGLSLCAATP